MNATSQDFGGWKEAYDHFQNGDWDKAWQALQHKADPKDPSYYFNLGVISLRKQSPESAYAYFKKSDALGKNPINARLLETTKASLSQSQDPDPGASLLESVQANVPFLYISWGLIIPFVLLSLVQRRSRKVALLQLGAFVLAFLCLAIDFELASRPTGILTEASQVAAQPGGSLSVATLKAGTILRLRSTEGTWSLIDYDSEHQGWVSMNYVLPLKSP